MMVWVSRQVGNGWRIMTVNKHPTAYLALTGWAVCASGVSGLTSYFYALSSVNVPSHNGGGALAYCPSGGIPTGGGFDSNYPDPAKLIPIATYPAYQNQWYSAEYNSTNMSETFSVLITCTKNLNATVTPRIGTQVSMRNGWAASSVDCNVGDIAIGGGFFTTVVTSTPETSIQKVRTFTSMPTLTNSRRWTARADNANQYDWGYVTPYAQCLHLN